MTSLWKFFSVFSKENKILKKIQRILDMPELKVIKPSDTYCLANKRCVKGMKASCAATVAALQNRREQSHKPKAVGHESVLKKKSTIQAIYLLDYALPQVAKLSKTVQIEKLDLSVVSSLVDATLQALNDAVLPAANWVLELLDGCVNLDQATGTKIIRDDIRVIPG